MNKRYLLFTILFVLPGIRPAWSQDLSFREDGSFKIVQFTDMHLRSSLPQEADAVYAGMQRVIQEEQPDMIILTGDNITCTPAGPEFRRLIRFLDGSHTPWCALFGNHDEQQDLSRPEMSALYAAGKHSLNRLKDDGELADQELPITGRDGQPAFYLYVMDSHSYSTLLGEECYDWFKDDQIQWLKQCCRARTGEDGTVLPALAFFHIPLCEYETAWDKARYKTGIRGENVCAGGLNSGMFAAMRESGSIIGTAVGHDHDNDYLAVLQGIALCYGRFSGGGSVYNHLPPGARVIKLREGVRGFETWIREYAGRVVRHTFFDGEKLQDAPHDRSLPYGSWTSIPMH